MSTAEIKRIRVLVNRRSGTVWSFDAVQSAIDTHWSASGRDITYQFLHGVEDGVQKTRRAVQDGMDLLLVVGGDGTFSNIGRELIGTSVTLGTIPTGSGNGFARHFGVPLQPDAAARQLAGGRIRTIDVGVVNERPFLITCSMAWDAAIVRSFDRMPMRGILPYVFAGVYEFFEYRPQPFSLHLDTGEQIDIKDPFVCTIANLSQYGGGAIIAPHAEPDDGILELVVARKQHAAFLIANVGRLMNGSIADVPHVIFRRFRSLRVERPDTGPIQMDGELVEVAPNIEVRAAQRALNILEPSHKEPAPSARQN